MIAIPLIALLVGCLCLAVFIIQLWTVYRKEKAQEERLRWLEHEHMVLEQKVYELRQDKLKEKEIEKGIVEILTENQKQIETLEKEQKHIVDLLALSVKEFKGYWAQYRGKPIPTKEDYKDHIVNKYTATRRATTSPYVTPPTAEDTTIEANTIKEIIKRLNTPGEEY